MSDNIKLSIEDMNLFYGNFHALHDINMHIPEKEITAFIGPSGCGKSTLLKSLNRMNDLVEGCKITGKVELDGEDIYGDMDVNVLRKRVGMVFQKPSKRPIKEKCTWYVWRTAAEALYCKSSRSRAGSSPDG